jgi:hypothetical protein
VFLWRSVMSAICSGPMDRSSMFCPQFRSDLSACAIRFNHTAGESGTSTKSPGVEKKRVRTNGSVLVTILARDMSPLQSDRRETGHLRPFDGYGADYEMSCEGDVLLFGEKTSTTAMGDDMTRCRAVITIRITKISHSPRYSLDLQFRSPKESSD